MNMNMKLGNLVMIIAISIFSGYLWGRSQGRAFGERRGALKNAAYVVSELAQKLTLGSDGKPSIEPLTEDQFADVQALLRVDRLIQKANK